MALVGLTGISKISQTMVPARRRSSASFATR
jgi:hypothetical protein